MKAKLDSSGTVSSFEKHSHSPPIHSSPSQYPSHCHPTPAVPTSPSRQQPSSPSSLPPAAPPTSLQPDSPSPLSATTLPAYRGTQHPTNSETLNSSLRQRKVPAVLQVSFLTASRPRTHHLAYALVGISLMTIRFEWHCIRVVYEWVWFPAWFIKQARKDQDAE